MKISELIEELVLYKREHGDRNLVVNLRLAYKDDYGTE